MHNPFKSYRLPPRSCPVRESYLDGEVTSLRCRSTPNTEVLVNGVMLTVCPHHAILLAAKIYPQEVRISDGPRAARA